MHEANRNARNISSWQTIFFVVDLPLCTNKKKETDSWKKLIQIFSCKSCIILFCVAIDVRWVNVSVHCSTNICAFSFENFVIDVMRDKIKLARPAPNMHFLVWTEKIGVFLTVTENQQQPNKSHLPQNR